MTLIKTYVATTGTVTIPVDLATSTPSLVYPENIITGTPTLTGGFTISPSGTPHKGQKVKLYWNAVVIHAGNTVTIFGQTIPNSIVGKNFIADCIYDGSAWIVDILVDRTTAIALTELADLTSANIIVGNASNVPTAVAVTGDVTISNTGVTAIAAGAIVDADINDVNASKLTGSIAAARIASKSLSTDVLSDIGRLDSKYSDTATTAVTTAEILYSYTVPADTCENDGEGISVIAYGTFAANGNAKSITAKFGTNTYANNTVTTSPNGLDFKLEFKVLRSGATSAVGVGEAVVGAVSQGVIPSKGGITWANDNDVTIIGQNGIASANDIVVSMVVVEQIR